MAVRKAIRSNLQAQPQVQQPKPERPRPNHQLKAEIFNVLERLNRGYGIALAAFDRLQHKDRLPGPRMFSAACLNEYRNRTEGLRADANRELLRLIAGHEDNEAERLGRLQARRERR